MNTHANLLLLACLLCLGAPITAQVELGLFGGTSTYEGDLSPTSLTARLQGLRSTFGGYGRIDVGPNLSFRGYVQQLKIQASDADRLSTQARNLSFHSNILELGVEAELYVLPNYQRIAPFVSFGASVYNFNPLTEYQGRDVELQPLGTEGQGLPGFRPRYALTRFAVPVGIGIRYRINDYFNVTARGSARLTFFDHLDDVSGNYVNYFTLLDGRGIDGAAGNGSLAAALGDRRGEFLGTDPFDVPTGQRRGDPTNNDWYYSATIGVGYTLGSGLFDRGSSHGDRGASRYNRCYQF